MTKQEFANLIGVKMGEIPQPDYELINYVYMWLPGIDKPLAAAMYKKIGLRAFRALKPWADEAYEAYDWSWKGVREASAAFKNSQVVEFLFSK